MRAFTIAQRQGAPQGCAEYGSRLYSAPDLGPWAPAATERLNVAMLSRARCNSPFVNTPA
jgi:hypothetical protein